MVNLTALRTINCRYNQITDSGIPGDIFNLEDLSVVVSLRNKGLLMAKLTRLENSSSYQSLTVYHTRHMDFYGLV